MYLYELPTTGSCSFSDLCVDQSFSNEYTSRLPEATLARANLRGALKELKRADHEEKDYLKLVKIIEEYLPQLLSIMLCVEHDEIGLKTEASFSWRTPMSANLFNASPRLSVPGLDAELAFTLLTYAYALSNLSRSIVTSLGSYEHNLSIPDAERKTKDERLNVAVSFLCKASGIFSFVSDVTLPAWEVNRAVSTSEFPKPPDLRRDVINALSKLSLAEAQTLAIRKLHSKAAFDFGMTSGPPLPKSHPSPALIAKLHLECASLYSSAQSLASNPANGTGEVSRGLLKYMADEALLHSALSCKWLGIDAGENGGLERAGDAISFLATAKQELESAKARVKSIKITKLMKEKNEIRKDRIADELQSINVFYKHYKKLNNTLHFRTVPTSTELRTRLPTGRLAVTARNFALPPVAFGPGSVERELKRTEGLEGKDTPKGAGVVTSNVDKSQATGSYAGAGSYF